MMVERELTDEQYDAIMTCLDEGDTCGERGMFEQAITSYQKGLDITPDPKTDWETSLHLYVALGDTYANLDQYKEAINSFNSALKCPDALGNPYVWLRLGQTYLELQNQDKAKDALMSAYMLEGEEIFEGEDEKYLNLIKPIIGQKENKTNSLFLSEKDDTVYKRFKGKNYTKEEWEAYEKEQWDKYNNKN